MARSPADSAPQKDGWVFDPAYLASLRELKLIFAIFFALLIWSIGVSYYLGYAGTKDAPVALLLGIPKWFLWGVAAPWATGMVVSVIFALFFMKDHEEPITDEDTKASTESRT